MNKVKLLGIEFIRILASYAVVLVHSGDETWGIPIDKSASDFRLFFYFGVPFFLALSFYLLTTKVDFVYSAKFWKSKAQRILVPYAVWTVLFFSSRAVTFQLTHKTERLQQLYQDPLSIIFCGGSSYHLYFLPLIFIGFLLVLIIPVLDKFKINNLGLMVCTSLSIALYSWLEISGNGFQLGAHSLAFKSILDRSSIDIDRYPLLRLLLIYLSWLIRCLPYLAIALLVHRLHLYKRLLAAKIPVTIGLGGLAILSNTWGKTFLPLGLSELILAFTLLLFSIALSKYFAPDTIFGRLVYSMGSCSFAIYFIHPFVMNAVKPLFAKVVPSLTSSVSIYSMLVLSGSCYLLSWLAAIALSKHRVGKQYLFGEPN